MGGVEGGQLEYPPLLTAIDARVQVHLVVGSNPLASARLTRSLEVGATPILIAPADGSVCATLRQKLEEGKVEWKQRNFQDNDLKSLGREAVDHYVDAVFVTIGAHDPLSMCLPPLYDGSLVLIYTFQAHISPIYVVGCGSL